MEQKHSLKGALLSIGKSLLYFAIYFAVQIIAIYIVAIIAGTDNAEKMSAEITIISGCLAILVFALIFKVKNCSLSESAYINKMPPRFVLTMVITGVATAYTVAIILGLIDMSGIIPSDWTEMQDNAYNDVYAAGPVIQFLSVGLMAPLLEEILFRGLILGTLKKQMHPWIAIVISALVFGAAHGTPISMIYATGLGILMGWIFVKFNSILPTILLHMAYNCAILYSENGIGWLSIIFSVPILVLEIIDINRYFRGKQK